MSFSLSAPNPVTTYLSIVKDESKQVALMVSSDPTLQRTEARFQADSVTITSPTDILQGHNLPALQVVLGAYNMSGQATQTGLLKQLLVQDPGAPNSLVTQTGNTNYLHFVRAMSNRDTVSMAFGDGTAHSFTTSGGLASSVSFRNVAWGTADAKISASLPAQSWSYVLNNGTASQSIADALTQALQATGTAASPVTGSYSVGPSGSIVGSSGAPIPAIHTDSSGNTVYALALAKNSAGATIRIANVISVTAKGDAFQPTSQATSLLTRALATTGFSVASGPTGFSITNPATNGALSLATNSFSNFAGLTKQPVTTYERVLFLGTAGTALKAGQTLLSGGKVVGVVQSVNSSGAVTLAAHSAVALAVGARIDVAIGAGVSNVGVQLTSPATAGTGATTLALGSVAAAIHPGQTITDGSNVIGIVKSVNASGLVTFTDRLAAPVAAGDTLAILPQVTTGQTPALSVANNATAILSEYATNTYETREGKQVTGLDTALYFSRVMPTITSINALMSDRTLLKVVTTNLGISGSFNNLSFDQQVRLLTAKVKLSDYSSPAKVQHAAEQYLVVTSAQALATAANNAIASMFGNPNPDGSDTDLLSTIFPSSSASDGTSLVSLFADNGDNTKTNNGLSLSI